MRIAWVKVGGLWPTDRGGRLRSFHLVAELSRRHELTLLTTHAEERERVGLVGALPGCERIVSVPQRPAKQGSAAFAQALARSWLSPLPVDLWKARVSALVEETRRLLESGRVDCCVADFLAAWPNVPAAGRAPRVLFQHNVEHVIWQRLAAAERRPWRRGLLELEWRKMRRFEAVACARADLTLAVSEADRDLLARLAPDARLRDLPTGVDAVYFAPSPRPETPNHLVFTGSMDWYPNEDGVLDFVERVLPLVRRELPDVRLTIAGRNPSARLCRLAEGAGAHVTGTVDDVRPYLADAAVVVVPLRVGGGTRLKIFEALAMGKAVVSTRIGAEGLPLTSGEHFVEADEPDAFARAVVALSRDPALRQRLGRAGRALVEARYSWAQVARAFERELDGAVGRADAARASGERALARQERPVLQGASDAVIGGRRGGSDRA